MTALREPPARSLLPALAALAALTQSVAALGARVEHLEGGSSPLDAPLLPAHPVSTSTPSATPAPSSETETP